MPLRLTDSARVRGRPRHVEHSVCIPHSKNPRAATHAPQCSQVTADSAPAAAIRSSIRRSPVGVVYTRSDPNFCFTWVRVNPGFGAGAAGSVPLLAAEVADPADPRARHVLRCAAAYALGEIGVASPAAVEALARVAGDRAEPQSLRTYSAEALMDLGPAAAAAVPVLERLLRDESEDDDLRHFAWSALKSVGAASREHPCGGTVAGHMRSLYRAGGPSEADGPGSGG